MSMKKSDSRETFDWTIAFYEDRIKDYIGKNDFVIARNFYHEMTGASYLASRLGIIDDMTDHNNAWFQRIQEAQFGRSGGAQV